MIQSARFTDLPPFFTTRTAGRREMCMQI